MRITIVFFVLFICTVSFAQAQSNAQIKSRHVRTLVTLSTEEKNGVQVKRTEVNSYDRKGNLIVEKRFDQDSVCVYWKEFAYGKKGVLKEERVLNTTGTTVVSRRTFEHNRFGDEVKMISYNERNQKDEVVETIYDADRRKIQVIKRNGQNELISTTNYSYDSKGMLILRVTLNSKGEVISSRSNQYTYAN